MLIHVLTVKIAATVLVWCVPLLLFPSAWLIAAGLPADLDWPFLRLLGWAYLALCVGYGFAWQAARRGEVQRGPLWMGVTSNGGASVLLWLQGLGGVWNGWGGLPQFVLWSSAVATALITAGLIRYGLRPAAR